MLFQNPTIQSLSHHIQHSPVIPTNSPILHSLKTTNSNKTPVFCIHPAGGTVAVYEELARNMGDVPVYAIEYPSQAGEMYSSIKEMAKDYLRIVSGKYSGPLVLCGFSLGGLIALEMAKIACEQQKIVKVVSLLDTKLKAVETNTTDQEIASILVGHLEKKSKKIVLEKDFKSKKDEELWNYCTEILQRAGILAELKPEILKEELKAFGRAFRYHMKLHGSYVPAVEKSSLPFAVQLFKPKNGQANELEWLSHLATVETIELPGDHHSVLEQPNVATVCTKMQLKM